jgi:hypothetical protein
MDRMPGEKDADGDGIQATPGDNSGGGYDTSRLKLLSDP